MDENYQAGIARMRYAANKGMAVIAMEPIKGGKLSNIPKDAKMIFSSVKPGRTPAAWALRWVWNHPEVFLLLSGLETKMRLLKPTKKWIRISQIVRTAGCTKRDALTI